MAIILCPKERALQRTAMAEWPAGAAVRLRYSSEEWGERPMACLARKWMR